MFYKDIHIYIMINRNTSQIFQIHRSVRQGCPISDVLFVLVVELLSISILNNPELKGIPIFGI